MDRPRGTPLNWIQSNCAGCGVPLYYDPAWELEAADAGKLFLPVCAGDGRCAFRAIMSLPGNSPPAIARAQGPGWRVTAERGASDE
jgi:hypothetical protein